MRKFNKMMWIVAAIAAVLMAVSLVSGCRSGRYNTKPDSHLDLNWGRAFEAAKYNQMANPDAPEHLESPTGIDGSAAEASVDRYRSGFKGEKSSDVYNLNLDVGGIAK